MLSPHIAKRRTAFTLIELLVVISIIALLIGILLPALALARKSAQAAQCLSSIRQHAIGMQAFSTDNKSAVYPSVGMMGGTKWYDLLNSQGYIDLSSGIHRCPNDTSTTWNLTRETSYAFNGYFASNHMPYNGIRLEDITNPAKKINVAEIATDRDKDHFMPMFWGITSIVTSMASTNVRSGGEIDGTTNQPASVEKERHNSASNYAFADGHGGRHQFDDTWDPANTAGSRTIDWYDPKFK